MAYKNIETAIKNLERGRSFFSPLFDNFRDNEDIVLLAIKEGNYDDGQFPLDYSSDRLQNDKSFNFKLVNLHRVSIGDIKPILREERDIVFSAVKNNANDLYYINDNHKDDKDIILEALKQNGYYLSHASDRLKNDKETVMFAINNNPVALEYTGLTLRNNKEVVMAAVKQKGEILNFASINLKADKEVVLTAVQNYGMALLFANKEFRNDKEIVLEAVNQNSSSLQYASNEIQELCKDNDPVKVLKSAILAEKLHKSISNKASQIPTKRIKI